MRVIENVRKGDRGNTSDIQWSMVPGEMRKFGINAQCSILLKKNWSLKMRGK